MVLLSEAVSYDKISLRARARAARINRKRAYTTHCVPFVSPWLATLSFVQVPPDKTDQAQPIDRGIGRLLKFHVGECLDK